MPRNQYTQEQKEQAVALLRDEERSVSDIRNETGIPTPTLIRWAKQAHLDRFNTELTRKAVEAHLNNLTLRRAILAETFLDAADELLARLNERHVVAYTRDGHAVLNDVSTARDAQSLVTAAAIALDKFRLEMGEATSIHDNRISSPVEEVKAKVAEIAERKRLRAVPSEQQEQTG